jgi:hypothetical protein
LPLAVAVKQVFDGCGIAGLQHQQRGPGGHSRCHRRNGELRAAMLTHPRGLVACELQRGADGGVQLPQLFAPASVAGVLAQPGEPGAVWAGQGKQARAWGRLAVLFTLLPRGAQGLDRRGELLGQPVLGDEVVADDDGVENGHH